MKSKKSLAAGLAVLIAVSGTTLGAAAQDAARQDRASESRVLQGTDFRSSKWMTERKVMNDNGEQVASMSDLIMDRGSGRIDYAVLKTGTILGLGGKAVAVSYSSLRWNEAGEHFVLPLTPEQLKQFPEFSEDEWKGVIDTKADAKILRQRLMTDAASDTRDPYAASLADAKRIRIKGEVTDVERVSKGTFGEQVELTVKTEDGERRVALGPSWYVNSGAFAPMRGDQVTIEGVALVRDTDRIAVARTMRVGDRDMTLRSEDGAPAWSLKGDETPDQRVRAARRYLLMSSLVGARADCRGSECGKVNDVILERRSGGLAFLSIDPNENFLGIADTKRLVPWSVAAVASDGVVRLDASKEMVLASAVTPDDVSTLNSGGVAEMVYKAYEVRAPRFEAARSKPAGPVVANKEAWSRDGAICGAIRKDSARTVAGKSKGTEDVKVDEGVPEARAITVAENGGEVLVLLGPAWYMKNQKLECSSGEEVKIETYRTTIAGKDYLIARSIECDGKRVELMDEKGSPAWDRR